MSKGGATARTARTTKSESGAEAVVIDPPEDEAAEQAKKNAEEEKRAAEEEKAFKAAEKALSPFSDELIQKVLTAKKTSRVDELTKLIENRIDELGKVDPVALGNILTKSLRNLVRVHGDKFSNDYVAHRLGLPVRQLGGGSAPAPRSKNAPKVATAKKSGRAPRGSYDAVKLGAELASYVKNNPNSSAGDICKAIGWGKPQWVVAVKQARDTDKLVVMKGERKNARWFPKK